MRKRYGKDHFTKIRAKRTSYDTQGFAHGKYDPAVAGSKGRK